MQVQGATDSAGDGQCEPDWRGGPSREANNPNAKRDTVVKHDAKRDTYAKHDETDEKAAAKWLQMLRTGERRPRPKHLEDFAPMGSQIFLEDPVQRRSKGSDKWVTSGGHSGATEMWATGAEGVVKRYGRVLPVGANSASNLKFAQYTPLARRIVSTAGAPTNQEVVNDTTKALWVVQHPLPQIRAPASLAVPPAEHVLESRSETEPVVRVQASFGKRFVSFQSTCEGEEGMELGAIARNGNGIKMESQQGDFAEWHELAAGEPLLEEGDVIGFEHGKITRRTNGCQMLGVVSRKAVVEGSAPPLADRAKYDCVAYAGIVPVKLASARNGRSKLLSPATGQSERSGLCRPHVWVEPGQILKPSGRNDGTAVLVDAREATSTACPRVGLLLNQVAAADFLSGTESFNSCSGAKHALVSAVVIEPSQTVPGYIRSPSGRKPSARRITWRLLLCQVVVVLCAACLFAPLAPARSGRCSDQIVALCSALGAMSQHSDDHQCDGPICQFEECCVDACSINSAYDGSRLTNSSDETGSMIRAHESDFGVLDCFAKSSWQHPCAMIPQAIMASTVAQTQAQCEALCTGRQARSRAGSVGGTCIPLLMYRNSAVTSNECCYHQPTAADNSKRLELLTSAKPVQCDCLEYHYDESSPGSATGVWIPVYALPQRSL